MRSSNKSRSRNKNNNRNRSVGNVVNRVFDSAGPEGKVRGTPQQIIEKYQTLARDAQLSGDRVAAENFQQHGEHYTRMLGEAMREQAEQRAAQEAAQRNNNQPSPDGHRSQERGGEQPQPAQAAQPAQEQANGVSRQEAEDSPQPVVIEPAEPAAEQSATQPASGEGLTTIDLGGETGASEPLVTTPEDAPKPRRAPRTRKPRTTKAAPKAAPSADEEGAPAE